jgi:hypothetical protein
MRQQFNAKMKVIVCKKKNKSEIIHYSSLQGVFIQSNICFQKKINKIN